MTLTAEALAKQAQEDINELMESGRLEEADARIRDLLKELERSHAQYRLDEVQCNLVSEMVWHRRRVAGRRPLVSTGELRSLSTAILSAYCEAISIVIADEVLRRSEVELSGPARQVLLDGVIFVLMRFFPFKIPLKRVFEHEYPDYIRQLEETDSEENQLNALGGIQVAKPAADGRDALGSASPVQRSANLPQRSQQHPARSQTPSPLREFRPKAAEQRRREGRIGVVGQRAVETRRRPTSRCSVLAAGSRLVASGVQRRDLNGCRTPVASSPCLLVRRTSGVVPTAAQRQLMRQPFSSRGGAGGLGAGT